MELLFITLAIATVATLGQLVDATGGRFGKTVADSHHGGRGPHHRQGLHRSPFCFCASRGGQEAYKVNIDSLIKTIFQD